MDHTLRFRAAVLLFDWENHFDEERNQESCQESSSEEGYKEEIASCRLPLTQQT
jgi:hypothetical protein